MFYRITEVSTEVASRHTYVLVSFWPDEAAFIANRPALLTNEFLMQLHLGPNLRQEIQRNIRRFWRRAQNERITGDYTGDATKRLRKRGRLVQKRHAILTRDTSDPNGVLADPDVASLRNTGHTL